MALQSRPSRRTVLATGAAFLGAVAGCADDSPSEESPTDDETTTETETADESETTADTTPSSIPDLDLREANVTGVEIEPQGDGSYRFSVTLYHDDDGEDGYADWWQVERLDGTQLGRRELLHAHSTAPFTRSTTVEIPDGVDCVVVRGHDQTHGYGGQAVIVTLETGARRFVQQGSDSQSFTDADCP